MADNNNLSGELNLGLNLNISFLVIKSVSMKALI